MPIIFKLKFPDPRKDFEKFRRIESKPLACVICGKIGKPGKYVEDPESITNSSFLCMACIKLAEDLKNG